ncbi:glutamate--cysteine ligase [Amphritea balenae]|uniref:Glutamate--cysteine ligase n=1 Tax=Amphritea balenae TaxID=452629 RepID=A0A3P1SIX5_9GAMM|nr:glutamate--cysteine ligase [Amphritea balenae]RRC96695.1 glutamate--cysteine ligase [Amphritea balenae]GGK84618.1 glutamate--cysteine ligase [Amphritea balenae]
MSATLEQNLKLLTESGQVLALDGILHGIEKEGLRVDPMASISQTGHPAELGSALTHSHITTDYSEALMEFITPAFKASGDALSFLEQLHSYTFQKLGDEQLWSASMPCHIDNEDAIQIARYGSSNVGRLKYIYRIGLEHRYGKMMQAIAGIHYNFSLPETLWPVLQELQGNKDDLQQFRSSGYFKLIRNFRRYSWLLLYLFGASPALSSSFLCGRQHDLDLWDDQTLYRPYATSLRMSDLGYSNKAQADLSICFNHLDTYIKTLTNAINTPYPAYQELGVKTDQGYKQLNSNVLQIENEYYSDIRPKRVAQSGEKPVHALQDRGVEYIEVRNTDINPLLPLGIDQEQADFLDAFLVTCLLSDPSEVSDHECELINQNNNLIVNRGREPGLTLTLNDTQVSVPEWGKNILTDVNKTAELLNQISGDQRYSDAVNAQQLKLDNADLTPSAQILAQMKAENLSYEAFILQQSKTHREALSRNTLSPEQQSYLEHMSISSMEEQVQIEQADNQSFDQYLADYLAQ